MVGAGLALATAGLALVATGLDGVATPAGFALVIGAAAAWGIAQGVVHYGLSRWGRCGAEGCANYYLDTSTNRAKRFCSPRCANRVHVAAFRSRRRA